MSSPHPNVGTSTTTASGTGERIDDHQWVIQIKRCIEEGDDECDNERLIPISIFNIPKSFIAHKRDVYIPQLVSIGPYHHCRPELHDMERYKLAAAKKIQKHLHASSGIHFHHLVAGIAHMEHRVRCSYHRYLHHNGDTLAWMMAVDAAFLVDFLHVYMAMEGKMVLTHVSSSWFKSVHNSVLRDVVMLENQIPLFLVRAVMEEISSSQEMADEMLCAMLTGLCKEVVPFKGMEIKVDKHGLAERAHLLDLVHHAIVPFKSQEVLIEIITEKHEDVDPNVRGERSCNGNSRLTSIKNCIIQFLGNICRGFLLFVLKLQLLQLFKRVISSKPFIIIIKIPWNILFTLPILSLLKEPLEYLLFHPSKREDNDDQDNKQEDSPGNVNNHPPLIEEITIPSVTELFTAGVTFKPTNNAKLSAISFDNKTATLHLPVVNLDENIEVVLRNLVAYEALVASGPLVLARYTEMMNGIIDGEKDVRVLREKGILVNRLKSDGEVAEVWNGMSKSVRLTKVPFLDKVIEDVNRFYESRWKVKIRKLMKRHVFQSWQSLALAAIVMLLVTTTLEAFCSVYTCTRR